MSATSFADRSDAGRQLAARLASLRPERPVVVALPRGGVPVGAQVAAALGAPLEILAVRKLGAPTNPEYGIGAVTEDGRRLVDAEAVAALRVDERDLEAIVERESAELRRRVELYRGERPPLDLSGCAVIVVDDGVATGLTDAAALRSVRRRGAARVVLAVPVGPPDSIDRLREEADEVICLTEPPQLRGVGQWYDDFRQVSDEEVVALLRDSSRRRPGRSRHLN
jgi:predicted phosphoribosyltransferase